MDNELRIAIVVSHPIQHFCPQYASFARNPRIHLKVFFASALGLRKYLDPGFKQEVFWGNLQLENFEHEFLNGEKVINPDKDIDALSLESALTNYQPGLIIIYGYFQKLQRRAHRWARRNTVPLAYISDSEKRQHRNALYQLLKYAYIKRYFSKVQFFLSVGDANEAFYRGHGVRNSQFIRMHFPIDIYAYEKDFSERKELRDTIRGRYQIEEHEIVLSVVGKLVSWKNQDHIIEALEILEGRGLFFHLFIIGSGNKLEEWKVKSGSLKKSRVHFTGFISIDELPAYYAATDIYTHPASIEPHSIAISEAIYMGCPVIISNRCGSYGESDDVQDGKNGYVFEFGNITELADKIQVLGSDADLRLKMSEYSHRISIAFQQQSHYGIIDNLTAKVKQIDLRR